MWNIGIKCHDDVNTNTIKKNSIFHDDVRENLKLTIGKYIDSVDKMKKCRNFNEKLAKSFIINWFC